MKTEATSCGGWGERVRVSIKSIRLSATAEKIYADRADDQLFDSIKRCGLLQEPVVIRRGGGYNLVSGRRRLQVLRSLGHKKIYVRVIQTPREDEIETIVEANRVRKKTVSQRYRESEALRPKYTERARQRQRTGTTTVLSERTNDALAAAVGLGSGRTLERLQEILRRRPDLLADIDAGRKTIGGAWYVMRRLNTGSTTRIQHGPFRGISRRLLTQAANVLQATGSAEFAAIVSILQRYARRSVS